MKINRLLLVSLILACFSWPVSGWQFYAGTDIAKLEPGYVLIEPDNWSRKDLETMRRRGITPLAWLNVSQIEESRVVGVDISSKDYVVSRRYLPEDKKLAVFYSHSFRELLRSRLREYLLKGFAGVVLAKAGYFKELSNSPINRSEMLRLLEDTARDARRLNSTALVIVHDASNFYSEIGLNKEIAGVIEEGLYYGRQGRQVRPWDRDKRLADLFKLKERGKLIMLAEDARTDTRRQYTAEECRKHGFDNGFAELPLIIERKVTDGSKK